jgi:two-component system, cell cycle response regulator
MPSPESDDDDDAEFTAVASRSELAGALTKKGKRRPWLVVVSGGGSIGKTYRLQHRLVVGRSPRCDVLIDEDGVSRRHAQLESTVEGGVQIVDLESRNGTFVNGEQVARRTLADGDKIQIGTTCILKFSYQDDLDEALQRNLYESATIDGLTQAVNKRSFTEALRKEFAFAIRHGRHLAVIAFDLDHFKRINDTHGHLAGDQVLARVGAIVAAAIRAEDVFARVGGEEFAVLLRDIPLKGVLDCAERIRRSIEQSKVESEGVAIPVTISVGFALLQTAAHGRPEQLMEAADRMLYEAKRSGRNRVCGPEQVEPVPPGKPPGA